MTSADIGDEDGAEVNGDELVEDCGEAGASDAPDNAAEPDCEDNDSKEGDGDGEREACRALNGIEALLTKTRRAAKRIVIGDMFVDSVAAEDVWRIWGNVVGMCGGFVGAKEVKEGYM